MNCPACQTPLSPVLLLQTEVDRCLSCGGLWLDEGELMRVAQYLKGNPALDRMAAAMAEHVEEMDAAKNRGEQMREWADSMATAGYDSNGFGMLVNALLFLLRRIRY